MPITRKEAFLSAIANGESSSIDPVTREEQLLSDIANGTASKVSPITRKEMLLSAISKGQKPNIEPITREEQYLSYIGGENSKYPENPITNTEFWLEKIANKSGGGSGGGSTDQTALAGAYTDATFTTREYTWDELLERGDYNNNGGIQPYENPPSAELSGYYYVYGENYAFVIPDTITTGVGTEGCKALVFPSTTTEFKTGMEGTIGTLYIKATTPPTLPWEEYFYDCNHNGSNGGYVNIVVPVGCGNAYKTATNWSEYADYIKEGAMPI